MRQGVKAAAAALLLLAAPALWLAVRGSPAAPPRPPVAHATPAPRMSPDRTRFSATDAPRVTLPDGSIRRVRSLLAIRSPLHHGDYVWNAKGVPAGPVWILIDPARQLLSVFRAGQEIGTAVVLFGGDGKPSPAGVFPIRAKTATYRSRAYDAPMPDALWLTRDGVAIHASTVRAGAATHGCIGVPPAFARLLFGVARVGDTVAILPMPGTTTAGKDA